MKLLVRLLFFLGVALFSQVSGAKKITAYIHNCTFLSNGKPYIETSIDITGEDLLYEKTADGKFQASVDIRISYEPVKDSLKKDSHLPKYYDYVLRSPEMDDTNHIFLDLFDLKRIGLDNYTTYNIEADLVDEAQPMVTDILSDAVTVNYDTTGIQVSDIVLIDTLKEMVSNTIYSKDGYDIQPRTFNYYPSDKTMLRFYTEVYNLKKTMKDEKLFVIYSVTKASDDKVMNDLRAASKLNAAPESFIPASFDITDLPSGNYWLNVEIRDSANDLLTKKNLYFQRSNHRPVKELADLSKVNVNGNFTSLIPKDSVLFYLRCLLPQAEGYEKQFIDDASNMHDDTVARQFIYNFWNSRNAANPEVPFKKYMSEVYFTEDEFGTRMRHGFETDRGRVYLEYGKPNQREIHNGDPSALPYEKWHYYTLSDNQNNIYFIFYEPDEITNDYTLIYSNAIGELSDDRWQYKVFGSYGQNNGNQNNYFNNTTVPNSIDPTNTPH